MSRSSRPRKYSPLLKLEAVPENKINNLLRRRPHSDSSKSPLYRLVNRALDLENKTNILRSILPASMALQFEVSNVRANRLTILAKNASWATRLRFETPRLLNQLCELQEFSQIKEIKIRSVSSLEPTATQPSLPENMSPPANEPLEELADRTEQGELKSALRKLAQHGRTNLSGHDPIT